MEIRNDSFNYYNPVRVKFGTGILQSAVCEAIGAGPKKIALFYGGRGVQSTGAVERVKKALTRCSFTEIGDITPNPDIAAVSKVLESVEKVDRVIGIGGGSVLDFAKICAFLAGRKAALEDILIGKKDVPRNPGIPFVAVPTTSGTGSEVTAWATVWDRKNSRKYSLASLDMYPRVAIIDPALTHKLPMFITACTGLDAMSHALEAFWSKHANPVSDVYALEALRLLFENLARIPEDPASRRWRSSLSRAALAAGLAFSNTKTTAVHSVSYPLTLYFNIPHGLACFLLLGSFLDYNLADIDRGKMSRLLAALGEEKPESLSARIRRIGKKMGLPGSLGEVGIGRKDIAKIVTEGFHPERVHNNPRPLTEKDLVNILEELL